MAVAVDAFNRGLIDRYIKKSDDGALDKLRKVADERKECEATAKGAGARPEPVRGGVRRQAARRPTVGSTTIAALRVAG